MPRKGKSGSRDASASSSSSKSSGRASGSRKRKQPEAEETTLEECGAILHRLIGKAQQLTDRDIWNHDLGRDKKDRSKKKRASEKEEDDELMHEVDLETEYRHLEVQPSIIKNGTLRVYQLAGVNWLINLRNCGLNGILADEMGLGKTLQTIATMAYAREADEINGPHLIAVPKSTLPNWCREFAKWCPCFNVLPFQGDKATRKKLIAERIVPRDFDVVVCSYEMVMIEKAALRKVHWYYVVVDEAHRLKNDTSKFATILRTFPCDNRLLITGTPLQNNLRELWALLNFLLPNLFDSAEDFSALFTIARSDEEQETVFASLRFLLQPFLLRRVKSEVEKDLPPKKEIILLVGMSEMQQDIYRKILLRDVDAIGSGKGGSKTRLLNLVMQLRKCCNHPYLFEGVEDMSLDPFGGHLIENAGKLHLLAKLLSRLKANGSRCLIFSQMTRVLDILEDFCRAVGYRYCRLDGSTSGEDRQASMDAFNEEDSPYFLFLLSTRAGGLGINLQTADIVIIYDSDWNPQMDLQAMDRVHRIGQTKPVFVYRLVTQGTVEERILERAELKLRLDAMVIQKNLASSRTKNAGKDKDSLLQMVSYGAQEMFKAQGSTITEDDIDLILSQGTLRTEELKTKWQTKSHRRFDELKTQFDYQTFEGEDYSAKRVKDENERFDLLQLMREKLQGKSTRLATKISGAYSRERAAKSAVNYNIDEYYRQRLAGVVPGYGSTSQLMAPKHNANALKPPKTLPELKYWQLWNAADIWQLHNKEWEFFNKYRNSATFDPNTLAALSDEESSRKQQLFEEGFSELSYRDFGAFVRVFAKFGRDKMEEAIGELTTVNPKTGEAPCELERAAIEKYAAEFFKRLRKYETEIREPPEEDSESDSDESAAESKSKKKRKSGSPKAKKKKLSAEEEAEYAQIEIVEELVPHLERILVGEETIAKRSERLAQILERRKDREERRDAWKAKREEAAQRRAERERLKVERIEKAELRYDAVVRERVEAWLCQLSAGAFRGSVATDEALGGGQSTSDLQKLSLTGTGAVAYTPLRLPDARGEELCWEKRVDRFLFYHTYLLGYKHDENAQTWKQLFKRTIEHYSLVGSKCFDFDFLVFGKTAKDLKHRVDMLIRAIMSSKSGKRAQKQRKAKAKGKKGAAAKGRAQSGAKDQSASLSAASRNDTRRGFAATEEPPKKRRRK